MADNWIMQSTTATMRGLHNLHGDGHMVLTGRLSSIDKSGYCLYVSIIEDHDNCANNHNNNVTFHCISDWFLWFSRLASPSIVAVLISLQVIDVQLAIRSKNCSN